LGEDPAEGIYSHLALRLVREGFAVFRYDKPGAGRSSPGLYATERSSALEAYTRAVDHARVDVERVYLVGHGLGCDTIAGIYPRFAAVAPPAGVILLDNVVGETDSVRIETPVLVVNPGKDPDDRYQYGEFVAEARARANPQKLSTDLVLIDDAEPGLLATQQKNGESVYSLHPRALDAIVQWLTQRTGNGSAKPQTGGSCRDTREKAC
jgi:alpha-beta hydrolase superfamily lysophospholipase